MASDIELSRPWKPPLVDFVVPKMPISDNAEFYKCLDGTQLAPPPMHPCYTTMRRFACKELPRLDSTRSGKSDPWGIE
jgi:hypothetical protein